MSEDHTFITCGELCFMADDGLIRRIQWRGIEVVRMINAPVRDAGWGTVPLIYGPLQREDAPERVMLTWQFQAPNGAFDGQLRFDIEASGRIEARWLLHANEPLKTNRAGFTLLHPIRDLAGQPVTVIHSDGRPESSRFPMFISPDQPALDITALAYRVNNVDVEIRFFGEVFEMEDQRNWSDASFKTYCRPLAEPFPYIITAGETHEQRIEVAVSGTPKGAAARPPSTPMHTYLPAIHYAVEPDWLGDDMPGNFGLTLRVSDLAAWSDAQLNLIGRIGRSVNLEVAVDPDGDIDATLAATRERMKRAGIDIAGVIALPTSYMKSIQPDGPWPEGPTPKDVAKRAKIIFDTAELGVGMLTYFTEFNRCGPPRDIGNFIYHGSSAIVHAADDISVFESLEALPHIFRSANKIAAGRDYRLGLMAIAMRSNPYGEGLLAGSGSRKRTMTDNDPRQTQPFAAAYAIAVTALAARAGVKSLCLAAPVGPFGAFNRDGTERPIYRAMCALDALGHDKVEVGATDDGLFFIRDETRSIFANIGLRNRSIDGACAVSLGIGDIKLSGFGGRDG